MRADTQISSTPPPPTTAIDSSCDPNNAATHQLTGESP